MNSFNQRNHCFNEFIDTSTALTLKSVSGILLSEDMALLSPPLEYRGVGIMEQLVGILASEYEVICLQFPMDNTSSGLGVGGACVRLWLWWTMTELGVLRQPP